MKIVIDTHILIHTSSGMLGQTRSALIDDARNPVYISEISLWEISKLTELGRIAPAESLQSYLRKIESHPRYKVIGLSSHILAEIPALSQKMHKDLADQILAATALSLGAKLMTDDRQLRALDFLECL